MKEIHRGDPPHRSVVYADWTIDADTRELTHKPTGAVFAPRFTDDGGACLVLNAGTAGADLEELGREGCGWFLVFGASFLYPQPMLRPRKSKCNGFHTKV